MIGRFSFLFVAEGRLPTTEGASIAPFPPSGIFLTACTSPACWCRRRVIGYWVARLSLTQLPSAALALPCASTTPTHPRSAESGGLELVGGRCGVASRRERLRSWWIRCRCASSPIGASRASMTDQSASRHPPRSSLMQSSRPGRQSPRALLMGPVVCAQDSTFGRYQACVTAVGARPRFTAPERTSVWKAPLASAVGPSPGGRRDRELRRAWRPAVRSIAVFGRTGKGSPCASYLCMSDCGLIDPLSPPDAQARTLRLIDATARERCV